MAICCKIKLKSSYSDVCVGRRERAALNAVEQVSDPHRNVASQVCPKPVSVTFILCVLAVHRERNYQ